MSTRTVKFATVREKILDLVLICSVNEQTPYSIREALRTTAYHFPQVIKS